LIKVKTTIGFGSAKQGTEKVHGAPLGKEDLANVKKKLGFDENSSFFVPPEVRAFYCKLKEVSDSRAADWSALFAEYGI
jgi:transketolase